VDPDVIVRALTDRKAAFFSRSSDGYRRNQPIASDIDPSSCLRRQVLEIVEGDKRPEFDADARERMAAGNAAEAEAMRLLDRMGVTVTKQQGDFRLLRRRDGVKVLGGKWDGIPVLYVAGDEQNPVIEFERGAGQPVRIMLEAKLCSPWVFDALRSVEDLARHWWTKRYYHQMQSYLIGEGVDVGVFMLHDGKRWKWIGVSLDLGAAEAVWTFAEQIVDAVEAYRAAEARGERSLPAYTKDHAQCGRCSFFGRVCNPEIPTASADFISDEALESDMARWFELRPMKKEYDAIDRRIKPRLAKGASLKLVGDFMVEIVPRANGQQVNIERIGVPGPAQEGA
jgi:hypothetical protein